MRKFNTNRERFSPRASLAAIGTKIRSLKLFDAIEQKVKIGQKSVKHTPIEKLYDAFINILSGAHGVVEINTRLRTDEALQRAFGRKRCAEQSVVQDTLDACTSMNVEQMQEAIDEIFRSHSLAFKHDFKSNLFIEDIDLTGLPCGKRAEFASKGYFSHQRNRRGRQLGRVLASQYQEIIVDRLYSGNTQLCQAFQPLVEAAERTLLLNEQKRRRTVLRVDSGGGSMKDVNWALERGYHFHGKDFSGQRAQLLAQSVSRWYDDPKIASRQVGWVESSESPFIKPVRRIAVRCKKNNGQWAVGVIVSTLSLTDALALTGQKINKIYDPVSVLLAYVYFYDQREGGVETEIKQDKQGLAIGKRNKKRFEAQQMLMLLAVLAHNAVIWTKRWLTPQTSKLSSFGIQRIVRDLFHISGLVEFDREGMIIRITLNQSSRLAALLCKALRFILDPLHIALSLGEI